MERCRQAVLEGLRVEFAHPPLQPMPGVTPGTHKMGPPPYPGFPPYSGRGRGRGVPGRNNTHQGKRCKTSSKNARFLHNNFLNNLKLLWKRASVYWNCHVHGTIFCQRFCSSGLSILLKIDEFLGSEVLLCMVLSNSSVVQLYIKRSICMLPVIQTLYLSMV